MISQQTLPRFRPYQWYYNSFCDLNKLSNWINFYRPPTKLREGNVFSRVCLWVIITWWGIPCDHYLWCIIGSHHKGTPLQDMGPHCTGIPDPSTSDTRWPQLETCLNLFTWGPHHWCWNLVATEACMVGKRAVRTLLECFLVILIITKSCSSCCHTNIRIGFVQITRKGHPEVSRNRSSDFLFFESVCD